MRSYFDEKGLVRQQLDSFNEFIELSMQQIVTYGNICGVALNHFYRGVLSTSAAPAHMRRATCLTVPMRIGC